MACTTCKKTKADIAEDVINKVEAKNGKSVRDYILKFLLFLIMAIVMTPILIPIFIIVLFNMVVLSKELNLLPIVSYIGKKIFKDKDDEDDDDEYDNLSEDEYDNLSEDEYELIDKDEIIKLD